jgi:hypothetical protein
MSYEVLDMLSFYLTLFISLFLFGFFSANIVGVGSWFACCASLTILPELGMVWFYILVWIIGCYLSRFVRLMGVAAVRICDLYIIYTASAIIQLVREQMVIVPFVNYDGAPVELRRRGREVS